MVVLRAIGLVFLSRRTTKSGLTLARMLHGLLGDKCCLNLVGPASVKDGLLSLLLSDAELAQQHQMK